MAERNNGMVQESKLLLSFGSLIQNKLGEGADAIVASASKMPQIATLRGGFAQARIAPFLATFQQFQHEHASSAALARVEAILPSVCL